MRELLLKLATEAIADIAAKALADFDRRLAEGDARVDAAVEEYAERHVKPPEG